ncbi:MAG TPA: M28 family peptidase [Gemmatimonadales bacterium]|nr:M28 family peptidase [Gemmatimonadales bacterium]
MSHRCIPLLLAVLTAGPSGLRAQTSDSITAADVRGRIAFLASDALRGRGTPSPGLEQAARYVAKEFQRLGLRPAGDSGYIQRYTILTTRVVPESSTVRFVGLRAARWRVGREVYWLSTSGPGPRDIAGPAVVLVGVPADSLHAFDGTNLHGAVLIHLADDRPDHPGTPMWLLRAAARAGAVACILVRNLEPDELRFKMAQLARPRVVRPGAESFAPFPVLQMQDITLGAYLAEVGVAAAGIRPVPENVERIVLANTMIRLHLVERIVSRRSAPNILAVLPGADSLHAGEYVALGAHVDALGVGPPVGGDSIYNGADDDASGTAAVLEVAAVLARGPRPRRSVLFALFSGTEQGLWGSEYYVARPTVPLARVVAFLNVESISRNMPDSVAVLGKTRSWLGAAADSAAARHPELGITAVDDPWPRKDYFEQSDQLMFVRHGVPALFFFNGLHGALHAPWDDIRVVNAESAARITRYVGELVRELANP